MRTPAKLVGGFPCKSASCGRGILGAVFVAVMGAGSGALAAPANPAGPQLDKWKTPRYNCYNYSQNSVTVPFQQPSGLIGKLVFDQTKPCVSAQDVMDGAVADGLTALGSPDAPPATPDGKSLLALVYDPTLGYTDATRKVYKLDSDGKKIPDGAGGFETKDVPYKKPKCDYHWYRLNDDKTPGSFPAATPVWSDKPGARDAKIFVKGNGDVVTNPKTADRGRYTDFLGYYSAAPGAGPAPAPTSPDLFARSGDGAQVLGITDCGFADTDQYSDIGGMGTLKSILSFITAQPQISDPDFIQFYLADPVNHFGGYSLIPDLSADLGTKYINVYQGVVSMYDDFNGTSTSIRYYADSGNVLGGFLAGQVPEPGPALLLGLGAVTLGVRSRRRTC